MHRLPGGLLAIGFLSLIACDKPCNHDADCDDGLFCNGRELCTANKCTAGTPPACDDSIACTTDICNEDLRGCRHLVPDLDQDGAGDAKCIDNIGVALGTDCDDNDPRRFPGFAETCDNHDEDCDPTTLGGRDIDRDGYVDSACSNPLPDGGTLSGLDCDDNDPAVHPGQLEACNGRDDNCNAQTDEGVQVSLYVDDDNDGWGTGAAAMGCAGTLHTSQVGGDCDDTNPAMHPGEISCVVGGQPSNYQLCETDGGFSQSKCPQQCYPQPNGLGFCL